MALKREFYSVGGQVLAERTPGGGRANYLTDALGSVTTTSKDTTATCRYSPYGEQGSAPTNASLGWVGGWGYRPTSKTYSGHCM